MTKTHICQIQTISIQKNTNSWMYIFCIKEVLHISLPLIRINKIKKKLELTMKETSITSMMFINPSMNPAKLLSQILFLL